MEPKLPAQAPESEKYVLGAMLKSDNAVAEIRGRLPAECFYFDAHQKIASAIYDLYDARKPSDMIAVIIELRKRGQIEDIGGEIYLADVRDIATTVANADYHAKLVLEAYSSRSLSYLLTEAQGNIAAGMPSEDVISEIANGIDRIGAKSSVDGITIQKSVEVVMANIDARMRGERPATLATGFRELDATLCGGLRNGGLTVIAARTSVGKTALALSIGRNVALAGHAVLVFSLEQQHDEITERNLSALSMVSGRRIITGELDSTHTPKIFQASEDVRKWKYIIHDRRNVTSSQIVSTARRHVNRFKCPTLIVIDYLSLIRSDDPKQQRYMQVGEIVKKLRNMAGDLGVPVLVLAQLNREAKQNELPEIRHIRESGDVEQDADAILLLYQEMIQNGDANYEPTENFRLIVAKQRNGPKADIALERDAATFNFMETIPK